MIKNMDTILKNVKGQKGITIMALVITIIIMLILASVTIYNFTNDDNSMLDTVEKQKSDILQANAKQEVEVTIEKIKLANVSNTELTVSEFSRQLEEKLKNNDKDAEVIVIEEGYKVKYNGYTFNYYYDNI